MGSVILLLFWTVVGRPCVVLGLKCQEEESLAGTVIPTATSFPEKWKHLLLAVSHRK